MSNATSMGKYTTSIVTGKSFHGNEISERNLGWNRMNLGCRTEREVPVFSENDLQVLISSLYAMNRRTLRVAQEHKFYELSGVNKTRGPWHMVSGGRASVSQSTIWDFYIGYDILVYNFCCD